MAGKRTYLKCLVCNSDVYNLPKHLRKSHPEILSEKDYYLKYINSSAGKCYCGNDTSFKRVTKGFSRYCSDICSTQDPMLSLQKKQKRKANLQEKYGEDVTNVMHIPGVKERCKNTHSKNCQEKYGVDYIFNVPELRIKGNIIKKNKSKEEKEKIQEKSINTLQKKYGENVTCGALVPSVRIKKDTLRYDDLVKFLSINNDYKLLLSLDEFLKLREDTRKENKVLSEIEKVYPLFCNKHNTITNVSSGQLYNLKNTENNHLCPKCQNGNVSRGEKELLEFVQSIYDGEILPNNKKIISPMELDVYIHEFKLGIEYHGLYWHSFAEKNYHLSKYLLGKEKGVKVIQVFEDEWKQKIDIVKSIILNSLKFNTNKIFARKLKVVEDLNVKEFVNKNHISGHTNYIKSFSLVDGLGEIISTLTLRKPFTKGKSGTVEIARFCSLLNTSVPGGFSKLLKRVVAWSKEQGFDTLLTYADLRFGEGDVYVQNGFDFDGSTEPNYFYTGGTYREGRFKYRAQAGMSEREFTEKCGVRKIYDCGSNRFIMKL